MSNITWMKGPLHEVGTHFLLRVIYVVVGVGAILKGLIVMIQYDGGIQNSAPKNNVLFVEKGRRLSSMKEGCNRYEPFDCVVLLLGLIEPLLVESGLEHPHPALVGCRFHCRGCNELQCWLQ